MKVLAIVEVEDNDPEKVLAIHKIYDEGDEAYWDKFMENAIENIQYRSAVEGVQEFNAVHLKALFEMLIRNGVLTSNRLNIEPLIASVVEKHYQETKFRWTFTKKKMKALEHRYESSGASVFFAKVKMNALEAVMNFFKKLIKKRFGFLSNIIEKLPK